MTIRAVLFDLDDTLFDHQGSAAAGLAAFFTFLGCTPNESLRQHWFNLEALNYARWLAGDITFAEQRRERLRHFLPSVGVPVPASETELDELFAKYLARYEAAWAAFPDAAETIMAIAGSGLTVGVLTNGNHAQQTEKIQRIGLATLVHAVFSSESVGHAKPSAEAFLIPCDRLQLSPHEVLCVGDNYRTDIEGARNAGLPAIHLVRDQIDQAPNTLRTLADLPAMLKTSDSDRRYC